VTTGRRTDARTYLFYRAEDFGLYVFALVVVFGFAWLAFPYTSVRVSFAVALAFFALTFALKRGATIDPTCAAHIVRGAVGYPARVVRKFWSIRTTRFPRMLALLVAIGIELVLVRVLPATSFWVRPFPYMDAFVIMFGFVTVFRTLSFVAHLAKAKLVRETLDDSQWQSELASLRTPTHILHAYITGLICHACALMPMLIFWRFTHPTYAREVILAAAAILMLSRGGLAYLNKLALPVTPHNWFAAIVRVSLGLTPDVVTCLYETHFEDHKSRFGFTVFHGQHHDAIPSAIMAAIDTGFVEAIDRSIWLATFVGSTTIGLAINAYSSWADMVLHQYIPGVYPYSQLVVATQAHHVAHHYGSLRPLGLGGLPSYKADLEGGYKPDNARVRWFLAQVKKNESLTDDRHGLFVQLDLPARLEDLAYMGFDRGGRT
jgi:hypothetical protein